MSRVRRWMRRLVCASAMSTVLVVGACGAGGLFETITVRRETVRFPAPGKVVQVHGRRMHILCSGQGAPTVLFEAGGTGASVEYEGIRSPIADRTRACAYDRAGMGWSEPSSGPLDARTLVRDLEGVLAAAGEPPPYILVSGSAGGLTAELFARTHPDDVAGLMFLDALHAELLDDAMAPGADRLYWRAALAGGLSRVGLLRLLDPYDLAEHPLPDRARIMALKYRAQTWNTVMAIVGARDRTRAAFDEAPAIASDVPLVVITHDPARADEVAIPEAQWRAAQARLADRSSRGRLVVADRSGHHPELDRPELVVALLEGLIEQVRSR